MQDKSFTAGSRRS